MKLIDNKILLFNLPLKTKEFGTIHQLKLKDFLEFDYARFKTVFSIRKDMYFDENTDGYDKIEDFDMVVFLNMLDDFCKALKLLCRTEEVKLSCKHNDITSIKVLIKKDDNIYVIDRSNYTKFANMILILLHDGNNIAEQEVKKELDEFELKAAKGRKNLEKKRKEREAEARKNNNNKEESMTIFDVANYIVHNDNKYDYQSVLDLTIYQLINTYTLYRQKEGYDIFIKYKTSGNFNIEQNVSHWFFGE